MNRLSSSIVVLGLAVALPIALDGRAGKARADDAADCFKGQGDTRIQACSRIIESRRLDGRPISRQRLAIAHAHRGQAHEQNGDYGRAIAEFDSAIRLNPNNPWAYRNRADAYASKGDLDRAIADYNKAININPGYAKAYSGRGVAYRRMGEFDQAIRDYGRAVRLNPRDAEVYKNRGAAYGSKGDYDRAIADYDAAIGLNPNMAIAYLNRGLAYAKKGAFDPAIADFDAAIGLNPNYTKAYANRGTAYRMKERQRARHSRLPQGPRTRSLPRNGADEPRRFGRDALTVAYFSCACATAGAASQQPPNL